MRTHLKNLRLRGRLLAVTLTVGLAFGLIGDRNVRSAIDTGQDPLNVLDLQAKAIAHLVIDTSGSMGETLSNQGFPGDHPIAKLYQIKDVLKDVIAANQATVLFSLGTYTQPDLTLNGTSRFTYISTDAKANSVQGTDNRAYRNGSTTWGGTTYYKLRVNRFYNGETIKVTSGGAYCDRLAGTATNPPTVTVTELTANNCDDLNAVSTNTATFTFYGPDNNAWNGSGGYCEGYRNKVPAPDCGVSEQLNVAGGLGDYLRPGLVMSSDGKTIVGYSENADYTINTEPTAAQSGLRGDGNTPIAESIIDLQSIWDTLWTSRIQAQKYRQATFAIVLTDGDDTCPKADGTTPAWSTSDANARRAARWAQKLYWSHDDGKISSRFKTIVIAFGTGASLTRSNTIAYGGSGMPEGTPPVDDAGLVSERWQRDPTVAEIAACKTCIPAYSATTKEQLKAALQEAVNLGLTEGEFADRAIVETIFEYGPSLDPMPDPLKPVDPLNPLTRYSTTVPILFQSSWTLPDFEGHLAAVQTSSNDTAILRWDAATVLKLRHAAALQAAGGGMTFNQLHASATWDNIAASTAGIKRRIFTTTQNGINTYYTPTNLVNEATALAWSRVALWPPETEALDGTLDVAMGIDLNRTKDVAEGMVSPPPYDFTALQTTFGACAADPTFVWPTHDCTKASKQEDAARREAREIILAFMAGAKPIPVAGNVPSRDATTGNILYTMKKFLMADATGAAPAALAPPPEGWAQRHTAEYTLFVQGLRHGTGSGASAPLAVDGLASGFGLRNPDNDGIDNGYAAENNNALKPVMSVVYHPANDMLHAFRAGPCPATTCADGGGEELWGLVPFDQLKKLRDRFLKVPSRKDHVFMLAAPVRYSDIFVPGAFSKSISGVSVTGTGVWRTILYAGRGAGGKYMTAIDITMPGPTTTSALGSTPPIVVWNRGNPDTVNGLPTGAAIDTSSAKYADLGETWSTPAIAPVNAVTMGKEFVLFMGSGYSDSTNLKEGRTFFALDALTGNVLFSHDVGNGSGTIRNAIVSAPGAYQPEVLAFNLLGPPIASASLATAVYFNDLHGQIFRFDPAAPASIPVVLNDRGPAQPFGAAMVLANMNSDSTSLKPHVYAVSGNDSRIAASSSPPFEMVGLRDEGTGTPPGDEVFSEPFLTGYRGTTQPAGAYKADGSLVVFFVGTRFLKAGETEVGGPVRDVCFSQFNSVVYMLEGRAGNAAYDIPGTSEDKYKRFEKEKITGIQTQGGNVYISKGLSAQASLPPKKLAGAVAQDVKNVTVGPPTGLSPLTFSTPIKIGSSVCLQ